MKVLKYLWMGNKCDEPGVTKRQGGSGMFSKSMFWQEKDGFELRLLAYNYQV